jgi:hypothetical protein
MEYEAQSSGARFRVDDPKVCCPRFGRVIRRVPIVLETIRHVGEAVPLGVQALSRTRTSVAQGSIIIAASLDAGLSQPNGLEKNGLAMTNGSLHNPTAKGDSKRGQCRSNVAAAIAVKRMSTAPTIWRTLSFDSCH